MLGAASLFIVFLWLAFALFVMGFAYGPLGGWLPELFPAEVRYTGVSMTFNIGGILGGALAADRCVLAGGEGRAGAGRRLSDGGGAAQLRRIGAAAQTALTIQLPRLRAIDP